MLAVDIPVMFHIASPSSQRKLGSSVCATSKALDPSFRWDDESGEILLGGWDDGEGTKHRKTP